MTSSPPAQARVAIITRTRDRPLLLGRAIRSVLDQTMADWVHVIVNDGGDPAAVDRLVRDHADQYHGRVRVVHQPSCEGMQHATNAGLAASASEFVAVHDDDDSWTADFLEQTVAVLDREGAASPTQGVVTQTVQVIEELTVHGEIRELHRQPYCPFTRVTLNAMSRQNQFPPIAFLYRRQVHDQLGRYRQQFDVLGDHDFNLRFLQHYRIATIPTAHAWYHWRERSQANTVTGGRDIHRQMLTRLKQAYRHERRRRGRRRPTVPDLRRIPIPPPSNPPTPPLGKRRATPADGDDHIPWVDQVDPFYYELADGLSNRIIDQVRRRARHTRWSPDRLMEKLGYEVAGPAYLGYLCWVLQQADHDGVPHLVLVGRDGYYWEQALHLMNRHGIATPTGSYLHASRKVLHFASFDSLDATALEFLLTPNPALRVRDFIDRTGLEAERYQTVIRAAGFRDPDRVLTTERGGRFRHRSDRQRLVRLFQELRPQLEDLFAHDRAGLESMLEQAGFDRARSALVDIGWRASSARAVARLVNASPKEPVRGYYFGTWTEAGQDAEATVVKSFFFDHGHPEAHLALIGEGVSWFEALHAAPYPPLIGFDTAGDTVTPRFSSDRDTGFSTTDHDRIWAGAAAFLEDILPVDPKASGQRPGWGYLYLVLERLLREPSAREVAAWGPLLHSEGFGLEIHEPLVQPRPARPTTANLFAAYRRSSWKRGFLASLSDAECTRLLRRIERSRRPWWQRFVP